MKADGMGRLCSTLGRENHRLLAVSIETNGAFISRTGDVYEYIIKLILNNRVR